jgi:[ribosomal protein S18]-alanine N-acetyltransferase
MAVVLFVIRSYRPEDFHILWEIDQSCFMPGISYSQFELRTYIRRAWAFTLVAEAESEQASAQAGSGREDAVDQRSPILGFVVAERTFRGQGHIITIDVSKPARRCQVGSALLAAAERQLACLKCQAVRLETAVDNIAALSFYKRHGYNIISSIPRYYSNGVDALLLEKNLH